LKPIPEDIMDRRTFALSAVAAALAAGSRPASAGVLLDEPKLGDDGLYHHAWALESFLDIGEDLTAARDTGKGLIVMVEQAGCPYCREMHLVNLRRVETVALLGDNFDVIQLDLRGSREATDLDGEAMPERELVRRWGAAFTPTLFFFAKEGEIKGTGRDAAAAVMPGYFKPFHFDSMIEFVASGAYKDQFFQDYINVRAQRMRDAGQTVTIWE
jgi:thioredoxin-related protein